VTADAHTDALFQHLKSEKSDHVSDNGDGWDQDELDYKYHMYAPDLYPNPYDRTEVE
jgi:hypothetical protein